MTWISQAFNVMVFTLLAIAMAYHYLKLPWGY